MPPKDTPREATKAHSALSQGQVHTLAGPLAALLNERATRQAQATLSLELEEGLSGADRLRLSWRAHPQGLDGLRGSLWTDARQRGAAALNALPAPMEQQRSGLLGHPELHGELFIALVFHLQEPPPERVPTAQLAGRTHDRYYRELPDMPGDLDSAAAILLSGLPQVAHLREQARTRLEWALAQSPVPVWESGGWYGPHCPAVTGRALMAAGALNLSVPDAAIAPLRAIQGWARSPHYPDAVVASALVLQGLEAVGHDHPGLRRLLATAPCGSWSPLAVAASVEAVGPALSPRRREQLLVRLLRTQRFDGAWGPSPWFMVPAPQGGMQPFGDAAYTTAAVLSALRALQPAPWRDLPGAAAR